MAKQLGEIERKNGRGTLKSFFFGTFIGIILTIGLLGGVLAFAYFKVSANWINENFKSDISFGNEDLDDLTLNEVVNHTIGLVQNLDTYTFNNLKDDFGVDIGDEIIGIDITDLKDVPVAELGTAVQAKFANISAYELRNVMDLDDMAAILSQKNTYYFNHDDNKLYKESTHDNEVDFDYTYDSTNGMIIVKGKQDDISQQNEVEFELQYLPLTIALTHFVNGMGGDLTIAELGGYGVTLPDFLNKPKYQNRKLSELDAIIDNMYVAEILGLNYTGTGDVTDGSGTVQTGMVAAIAKLQVGNMATDINTLTIADLFGTATNGILSLIPGTTALADIPTAINNVLATKTIDELITAQIVESPSNYNDIKDKYINIDVGTAQDPELIQKKVSDLVLGDMVKISFKLLDIAGGSVLQDTNPNP